MHRPTRAVVITLGFVMLAACGDDDGAVNQNVSNNSNENVTGPICGDGNVQGSEACDEGSANSDVDPDRCRTDCTSPRCGDGVRDPSLDEACDEGSANSDVVPDRCRTDCTLPACGDAVIDPGSGEICDDGAANAQEPDAACRTDCSPRRCGDAVRDTGEDCDAGDANSDVTPDACRSDCASPSCGDAVIDTGELCDDANAADWDGCVVCEITDFALQTGCISWLADVAAQPDGGLVFVLNCSAAETVDVLVRRYDPVTATLGPLAPVSGVQAGERNTPRVAAGPDGGFVVAWEGTDAQGLQAIFARRFDATGSALGGEFAVSDALPGPQSAADVSVAADGAFVIAWVQWTTDATEADVRARWFDADGAPVTGDVAVHEPDAGWQSVPAVGRADDGRTLVVWQSADRNAGFDGIYGRWFDTPGTVGDEVEVHTTSTADQAYPALAVAPDGFAIVVWTDATGPASPRLRFRRWDPTGSPIGDDAVVPDSERWDYAPAVAIRPDHHAFIAWLHDENTMPMTSRILGVLLDPDGNLIWSQRLGFTPQVWEGEPAVSMDLGGVATVVRAATLPGVDGPFGQRYDAAGVPLGLTR